MSTHQNIFLSIQIHEAWILFKTISKNWKDLTCKSLHCLQTMQDPSHKIIFKTPVLTRSLHQGTTLVVPIYRLITFHPSRFTHRPPESRREWCTISLDELCLPSSGCDWRGAGRGTPLHTSRCYMPCGWGLLPSQAQNSVPHQQTCTQHKTELHLLVHALAADEYETTAKSAPEWQHMLIFVTLR